VIVLTGPVGERGSGLDLTFSTQVVRRDDLFENCVIVKAHPVGACMTWCHCRRGADPFRHTGLVNQGRVPLSDMCSEIG